MCEDMFLCPSDLPVTVCVVRVYVCKYTHVHASGCTCMWTSIRLCFSCATFFFARICVQVKTSATPGSSKVIKVKFLQNTICKNASQPRQSICSCDSTGCLPGLNPTRTKDLTVPVELLEANVCRPAC